MLTWVMFQNVIISATGSVATEQPLPRRATLGGSVGISRKNSCSDVWWSHCREGEEVQLGSSLGLRCALA